MRKLKRNQSTVDLFRAPSVNEICFYQSFFNGSFIEWFIGCLSLIWNSTHFKFFHSVRYPQIQFAMSIERFFSSQTTGLTRSEFLSLIHDVTFERNQLKVQRWMMQIVSIQIIQCSASTWTFATNGINSKGNLWISAAVLRRSCWLFPNTIINQKLWILCITSLDK